MFLYLSKLLPLFFYPLGLISICLIVALVTLRKRPRMATIAISLSLAVLLLSSNAWVSKYMIRSLEWQNIPRTQIP
ncbi:YdcF family protein, partial [Dolichospermum sp. ST_sed9]|nr:YdcF family protein [Dolichospermum sp. ST_sed9]